MTPDGPKGPPPPDDMSLTLSEDMLAAEYVLGTLDPAEREDARGRIASDFSFAALVQTWERRLGELSTSLQRREADLNAMARKLQLNAGSSASANGGSASDDDDEPRPNRREDIDPTQKRLQFWSR